MRVGSIVEYIGGQDTNGKLICPLEKNRPYMVSFVGVAYFKSGPNAAIGLEEIPNWYHLITMFKELSPPEEVSVESILEEPELV